MCFFFENFLVYSIPPPPQFPHPKIPKLTFYLHKVAVPHRAWNSVQAMPFDTVMQFLTQSEKNTWWLLLHPPNQPFSLARPSSILPAAQKRCEGLLCIQKSS